MSVFVCDALCGFGKTSAAIKMMNTSTDKRFIFVTQFLSEVDRIVDRCPDSNFESPSPDDKSKMSSFRKLLDKGGNIATTHALLSDCSAEVREAIKEKGYTLVLDEVMDVFNEAAASKWDVRLLNYIGMIDDEPIDRGVITSADLQRPRNPDDMIFYEPFQDIRSKNLILFENNLLFWTIPPELFSSFQDVWILTYMFSAQPMRCYMDINGFAYQYIGVHRCEDEYGYEFCDFSLMDRRMDLRGKIHILDHEKMNMIGGKRYDLSFSWFNSAANSADKSKLSQLRKNIWNLLTNIYKTRADLFMWTAYKNVYDEIHMRGPARSFVPFNKRACNEYADRKYLAYCVNNFPRPIEVKYYKQNGSALQGDMYALSTMVQWIFRSAIRRGEEIWIYIPSARMRYLLEKWMDNLAEGKDLETIRYTVKEKKR